MKKITLTCNVTGKQVTYTSEAYIAKRIEQAGSLEKLMATFVSREGKALKKGAKPASSKTWKGEDIIKPSKQEVEHSDTKYQSNTYTYKDGPNCTVVSPVVAAPSIA